MANKANSLSHTKWMCKYHIVFTPKYRRKIIYNQYKTSIRDILKQLCAYKGVEIIEASCPDKVCIHQGFITKASESIVCLPNKVHIKITTEDNHESEEDVISK